MNTHISKSKRGAEDEGEKNDVELADPSREKDAGTQRSRKHEAPGVVPFAVPKSERKTKTQREEAEDDLWDNVPI